MTGGLGVLLLGSAPEHGLSTKAVEIGRVFDFPVTNSILCATSVSSVSLWLGISKGDITTENTEVAQRRR